MIENFISPKEEQEILLHLKPSRVISGFGRNRVYRYGSKLPYKGKTEKIPDWLFRTCLRVGEQWTDIGYFEIPDHVTINEYHKGQSIDWHIDSKKSGPIITVLSLESEAIMGLRTPGNFNNKDAKPYYPIPVRSLLHMTEGDRWDKQHCIYPVSDHRWSLVFRKGTE